MTYLTTMRVASPVNNQFVTPHNLICVLYFGYLVPCIPPLLSLHDKANHVICSIFVIAMVTIFRSPHLLTRRSLSAILSKAFTTITPPRCPHMRNVQSRDEDRSHDTCVFQFLNSIIATEKKFRLPLHSKH